MVTGPTLIKGPTSTLPKNSNCFHQIFSEVPVASKIRVKLQKLTRNVIVWSCGLYVTIVEEKLNVTTIPLLRSYPISPIYLTTSWY